MRSSKFGKEPKDLRVAIIHEDGAYGVDVAKGQRGPAPRRPASTWVELDGGLFRDPRPICPRW